MKTKSDLNHLMKNKFLRSNPLGTLLHSKFLIVLLFSTFMFGISTNVSASHYRYGNITWRKINNSTNQVEFTVTQAWRMSAFFSGTPSLGTNTGTTSTLDFGDGGSVAINLKVTSVNPAEDWFVGEFKVTRTYASNGNYTANFYSCCRITLNGSGSNDYFRSASIVNIGTTNNSPTSTMPAIINLQTGLSAAAFTIPGADPDNDNLTWSVATSSDVGSTPQSNFSVNSSGAATFNTTGLSVNNLYFAAAVISDGNSTTMVDFIVKIVAQSNPPAFDYTVTPTNGFTYQVPPSTNVSFTVKATDADAGNTVSLSAVGVPPGASWSPGSAANPVSSTFSWTPGNSDLGTRIVTFTAQDNNNVQTQTSVTIKVSLKPIFSIPPTPATATLNVVEPGDTLQFTARAYDPDAADVVTINKLEGLNNSNTRVPMSNALFSGVSFSLPTSTANPTSGNFSWIPGIASWGVRNLFFTAEDSYGDKTEHQVSVIVNTTPVVTSTAPTSACVDSLFTYNFVAYDPDIAYGDTIQLHDISLPAWLTFTDNGDGTATISGTPSLSDTGNHSFSIHVEDLFHHSNVGGIPEQDITITVGECLAGCGAGTPSGANVKTGNVTISTQTQMNAFFNSVNGNKWTKVSGDLTINGNSSSDPITDLCNLSSLTEVTGQLLIQQFTRSGNPTDLSHLAALTKAGRLTIITCPSLTTISLPELTHVAGALIIRNNRFAKTIKASKLTEVGGSQFMIIRNHRAETIQFSNLASIFTLSNTIESTSVDIQSNGDSAANALTMDFNKITEVSKNFTFANNKNSGVTNFDNIFSSLSAVGLNMVITNNTSLNKCCIAASTVVSGTRTISGNTGNCATLTAVATDCGTLNKKQSNRSTWKNTDLFGDLTLYPSPNKGNFEIGLTTTQTGMLNLTVLDLVGRVVLTQSQEVSGTVSIPVALDKAAEGQYIVKLELNGNLVVKRVQVIK